MLFIQLDILKILDESPVQAAIHYLSRNLINTLRTSNKLASPYKLSWNSLEERERKINSGIYVFYNKQLVTLYFLGLLNTQPLLFYRFIKRIVGISVCLFVVNSKLAIHYFLVLINQSLSKKQVTHISANHLVYSLTKRLFQFAFDLFCKFFLTNRGHIISSNSFYKDLFTIKKHKTETN